MLPGLLQRAWPRLLASAYTIPTAAGWMYVGASLAATAVTVLPFGTGTGFLKWSPVKDKATLYGGAVFTLISPSLLEEAFFRAVLLPHPQVDGTLTLRSGAMAAALPLAIFIAYHLVNPSKKSREVFWDPRFLTMAGILGAACSFSYWATGGSLLAAIVTHWVPVYVWLFCFGGFTKVHA